MTDNFTYDIIGNSKGNPEGELIVVLFEFCNLSCQFCAQDHSSIIGMNTVKDKAKLISKNLEMLKERGKTSVSVNIMGGELFSDQIDDEIFNDYVKLVNDTKIFAKSIDLPISINFATNLIWSKRERVLKLLKETDTLLSASYDPAGRFNPNTLQIFVDNCKFFKDHIVQVGVVMTKPNIERFIKKNAPEFDFLYENFTIIFDHYTHSERNSGRNNLDYLLPEDQTLRDFYKFMVDHYPKAYPFIETFNKNSQNMGCMRTVYIFPDDTWGPCGSYEGITKKNTLQTIKILDSIERKIETSWYSEYDCMSCEHMQRCSFSCFLNNHFYSKQRTQEICWLKEVYDYVDSK